MTKDEEEIVIEREDDDCRDPEDKIVDTSMDAPTEETDEEETDETEE